MVGDPDDPDTQRKKEVDDLISKYSIKNLDLDNPVGAKELSAAHGHSRISTGRDNSSSTSALLGGAAASASASSYRANPLPSVSSSTLDYEPLTAGSASASAVSDSLGYGSIGSGRTTATSYLPPSKSSSSSNLYLHQGPMHSMSSTALDKYSRGALAQPDPAALDALLAPAPAPAVAAPAPKSKSRQHKTLSLHMTPQGRTEGRRKLENATR